MYLALGTLGTMYQVLGTMYLVSGTEYLLHGTMYLALRTTYLVPAGMEYPVLYLVPSTWPLPSIWHWHGVPSACT